MELPTELILKVIEYLDVTTIENFMGTNKRVAAIIKTHEKYIAKARAACFVLPPLGDVLSSNKRERRILPADSIRSIKEFELRDTRINAILQSEFLGMAGFPCLDPLTGYEKERLVQLLKRALYHCDRIADIAANMPGADIVLQYSQLITSGVADLSHEDLPSTVEDYNRYPSFTNLHARALQIEYLRAMELPELSVLYYLITIAGLGFIKSRPAEAADPNVWERITVFEECLLRHGTWFLWAQVTSNDRRMESLLKLMMRVGFAELIDWETGGVGMRKGLRMSLREVCEEKMEDTEGTDDDDTKNTVIQGQIFLLVQSLVEEESVDDSD